MVKRNVVTETSVRVLCSKKWKHKVLRFAAQLGTRELAAEGNMSEVMRRATDLYMKAGIDNIPKLESYVELLARNAKESG